MQSVQMRCSPHPPTNSPRLQRRLTYQAPSLHPQRRAAVPSAPRPPFPLPALRWLPGLAVPHGAAWAAVPGATARAG
jgi:hypothetical protein